MDDNSKTDTTKTDAGGERIAKAIARAGLASRREAEQWIAAGRVAVNGVVVTSPALNVTARDRIAVDGAPLPKRERTRLFLYHKPRGLVTTHADPKGRPTIFEHLPEDLPRLISVGRLDLNTEGLLLLTNDGGLARELELPTTGWLRRYRVRAHGTVMQPQLDELRAGIIVDGIHYGEIDATLDRVQGANLWLTFAIREGKNREVRNVLGHLGLTVNRLIRVSFGPFQLGDLAEGEVEEVRTRVLREQLGERLITASGADFSTPPAPAPPRREPPAQRREAPPRRHEPPLRNRRDQPKPPHEQRAKPERPSRRGAKSPPPAHSWRGGAEAAVGKKLQRKFRGSRRDAERAERSKEKPRAGLLTDRKGRRVLVERFKAKTPPPEMAEPETTRQRSPRGRGRRSPDRASGARPHRPRKN
jgi:23S rRNA pseudouridine2605 synthase